MRADRVYHVLVGRSGRAPALFAEPDRIDHIEVVEIDSGEVVLFWDARPREATRLARRLRADLSALEAEDFLAEWSGGEVDEAG